ncbi:MAG TPA: cation diffusion facilitator family transporter, partial [Ktedonobacterales bacterium]
TAVILFVELVGGVVSHSLALLSDAGHVLTDLIALGLAWFATVQAGRPANARNTYGYHRTGILTALANALALLLIVFFIGYEALRRLQRPTQVTPWIMFAAAAVSIAVNLYIAIGFRAAGSENLNLRAALLHVIGDMGAALGVLVAGLVIFVTRWYQADPIISLLIALLIARGAWNILHETVDILMEATPRGLNMAQLVGDMVRQPGITDVHDLHVWSIAGGMRALSAHVQVKDGPLSDCDNLLAKLNALLQMRYGIAHSTIQFECDCCDTSELYCTMRGQNGHAHVDGLRQHELTPGGQGTGR